MLTSALLAPQVFRERDFSVISITSQLWVVCVPRLSPVALFLGYIQTWQQSATLCSEPAGRLGWESEAEPPAVLGLLHRKRIRAHNEGPFPKTSIFHLTLRHHSLPGCSHQNRHKRCRIMHLPIVWRLPLPLEGLAIHFPSDES